MKHEISMNLHTKKIVQKQRYERTQKEKFGLETTRYGTQVAKEIHKSNIKSPQQLEQKKCKNHIIPKPQLGKQEQNKE